MAKPTLTPLKVLMLHGFTQSGPLFHGKTRALQKALQKALPRYSLSFSFPTAPHRLLPFDLPPSSLIVPSRSDQDSITQPDDSAENYGWWRRTSDDPIVYEGMGEGFARIREAIRDQGPFDGVIGFSQGAARAALVVAALEECNEAQATPPSRQKRELPAEFQLADSETQQTQPQEREQNPKQGPLKFAILYSGFRAADPRCDPFFTSKISTPTMHVLGALDSVVEESRARALVACCRCDGGEGGGDSTGAVVMIHPGGHFLPSQRVWLDKVTGFVRRYLDGEDVGKGIGAKKGGTEERVEDMDLPF